MKKNREFYAGLSVPGRLLHLFLTYAVVDIIFELRPQNSFSGGAVGRNIGFSAVLFLLIFLAYKLKLGIVQSLLFYLAAIFCAILAWVLLTQGAMPVSKVFLFFLLSVAFSPFLLIISELLIRGNEIFKG